MSLRRRDRQQQSEGLRDREGERYGWQAAITETEAPCEHSQVCVCVTVCEEERGTERERGGEEEGGLRSLPAWAPADSHTGRSQAHHVSSVCGNPPSSNDKFATRLPLSDLGREAEEMSEGKKGCVYPHVCVCVSASLCRRYRRGANYLLLREQLCHLRPFIQPPAFLLLLVLGNICL